MITIHKFQIKIEDAPVVEMDPGGRIFRFDAQHERLVVWALVDTDVEPAPRHFQLASTGYPIRPNQRYLGTAKLHGDDLVFHLLESLAVPDDVAPEKAAAVGMSRGKVEMNNTLPTPSRPLFNRGGPV